MLTVAVPKRNKLQNIIVLTPKDGTSLEEKEALSLIKKVDKQRKFYYNYYTDKKWEEMSQYDLCLDSSAMSEDEILNVLTALYESIL